MFSPCIPIYQSPVTVSNFILWSVMQTGNSEKRTSVSKIIQISAVGDLCSPLFLPGLVEHFKRRVFKLILPDPGC